MHDIPNVVHGSAFFCILNPALTCFVASRVWPKGQTCQPCLAVPTGLSVAVLASMSPLTHGLKAGATESGLPLLQISDCRKIEGMTSVRMDKWLWAARFFKTRALAARACELGRIQARGQLVKPARDVHIGDMLRIKNDGGEFEVEVLELSEVRGPAAVAQTLYRETDASREQRLKVAAEHKAMRQFEELPAGRPSKRDRRKIMQFRGRV